MTIDQNLLAKMKEVNKTEIEKLEEAVKDAEENLGEIEIRDAKIAKAEYLSEIGDKVIIKCWICIIRNNCLHVAYQHLFIKPVRHLSTFDTGIARLFQVLKLTICSYNCVPSFVLI